MSSEEIINIQDMKQADILIERGERNYSHLVGMIAFKALVEARLETYTSAASRNDKTYLTYKVLESVTASGGRFVVRNGKGDSQELRVLDKAEARRKARDCFRDCIKNARRGVSKRPSGLLNNIGLPREMFSKSDTYTDILHRVATNPRVKLFVQTKGSSAGEASRDRAITPAAISAQASYPYSPPKAMSEAVTGAAAPDVGPALPLKVCRGERDTNADILHRVATNPANAKQFFHTTRRGSAATEASRITVAAAICTQAATGPSFPCSPPEAMSKAVTGAMAPGLRPALPLEMVSGERDIDADILHRVATHQRRVKLFLQTTRGSAATEASRHMAITPAALCAQAATGLSYPCSPPEAIREAVTAAVAPGVRPTLPLEMFSGEQDTYADILYRVATNPAHLKQFLQTRGSAVIEASRHTAKTPAAACSQAATALSYPCSPPEAMFEAVTAAVVPGVGPADIVPSSDMVAPDSTLSRSRGLVASVSIYCKGAEK